MQSDRIDKSCVALFLLCVGVLSMLAGCVGEQSLPDAVYGGQIPVYPKAKLEDVMGMSEQDVGGPVTAESTSWFYVCNDPVDDIRKFYAEKLPEAEVEDVGGEVMFSFVPQGAESGEEVSISISEGKLQITETVKPGKGK